MSERNDGGPAFPGEYDNVVFHPRGSIEPQRFEARQRGMSLRDYFAAKAMQGLMAQPGGDDLSCEQIARCSYLIATHMIEVRESQQ